MTRSNQCRSGSKGATRKEEKEDKSSGLSDELSMCIETLPSVRQLLRSVKKMRIEKISNLLSGVSGADAILC